MKRKKEQQTPFLLIFPWGKVAGLFLLFLFGAFFVYRLSETGGLHVNRACFTAVVTTVIAGLCGIYPICKAWGRDVYGVLIGVTVGAVIRLLITGVGVAIITYFTATHRSWFLLFLGVYYIAFLAVDTWVALWVLQNSEMKDRERRIHGNVWDMFG